MNEQDQKPTSFNKLEETYLATQPGSPERCAAETFTIGALRWRGYNWLVRALKSQRWHHRSYPQNEYALKTFLPAAKPSPNKPSEETTKMPETRFCEALDTTEEEIAKTRKALHTHLGTIRAAILLLEELGDEDAQTLKQRHDHARKQLSLLRADVFTKILAWQEIKQDEEPEQVLNDKTFWQPVIDTLASIGTAGWKTNKTPYTGKQFDRNIGVAVKTTPGFADTTIQPPPAHMNDGKRHETYTLDNHVAEAQFLAEQATEKSRQMAEALEEDFALAETWEAP